MTTSTTEKVAQLLLAFEVDSSGGSVDRSVSELARIVGRERSQVSRMLQSLSRAQVVEQDPETRRYRLSWRVRVMAGAAGDQLLVRAARPMLQVLVARTDEVALLSVQDANRSLTVLREESQNSLRGGGWVGRRSPMHYSASGRALMFDYDGELIEALTADDMRAGGRIGPNSPRRLDDLLKRLHAERRQGFAVASEEIEVGLTSIGAPVRNAQGHIVAVVNVSGPTSRVLPHVSNIARLLLAASTSITRSLDKRHVS
ncbi:IclR family transcriptional regulator domain-containing protein [Nocardia sp. R6R-6]|uniref:IclR family transcriptional regulator domain-containing protein n=1 Tax=Nocardia sp. R6R-6 TaxID=3459303 RepID=UPI00403D5AFC